MGTDSAGSSCSVSAEITRWCRIRCTVTCYTVLRPSGLIVARSARRRHCAAGVTCPVACLTRTHIPVVRRNCLAVKIRRRRIFESAAVNIRPRRVVTGDAGDLRAAAVVILPVTHKARRNCRASGLENGAVKIRRRRVEPAVEVNLRSGRNGWQALLEFRAAIPENCCTKDDCENYNSRFHNRHHVKVFAMLAAMS